MISFNFDYLTNNLYKNKVRTEKNQPAILVNFYNTLILLIKKTEKNLLRTAFLLVLANPRPKMQKLEIIQPVIQKKLEAAFLNLTRYCFMSHKKNQTIPKQKKYSYPLSILSKVVSLKRAQLLEQGFIKVRLNKRNKERQQKILRKVPQFLLDYLRKNIYPKGFRAIKSAASKRKQYAKHLKYFQYTFQSIRMRKQFDSFALLGIKTSQKMISDLQKDKGQKRVMATQKGAKRTEVINELKRKLYNMKAQVNEGQILNDKKKVDGTKQNGQKLIKKNQEMRIIEINTSYLQIDVYNLQKELISKQDFIQSRAGNKMKLQQIKTIYDYIRGVDTAKDGKLIYSKLIPVSKQKELENKHSYIITQNVKLKHLMSLYEKVGENKKTDSYNNAQNQNSSLKMLVASIFKAKFMEPQRQALVASCHQIQQRLQGLNDERQKLKGI